VRTDEEDVTGGGEEEVRGVSEGTGREGRKGRSRGRKGKGNLAPRSFI